ncbi:uncharacterized protein [Littorina saxatilis]|uniref:Uncharacterized protein n=1 Tax=Littorina saxatilis TaxID=31220 RepID=A0AAN9BLU1_9CAEN
MAAPATGTLGSQQRFQLSGSGQRFQTAGSDQRFQQSGTGQRIQMTGADPRLQPQGTEQRFQPTGTDQRVQPSPGANQRVQPSPAAKQHIQPTGPDQRSQTNGTQQRYIPEAEQPIKKNGTEQRYIPTATDQSSKTNGTEQRFQYDYLKHYRELQDKERLEKEKEKERERRRLAKQQAMEEKENDTDDEDLPAEELKKRLEKLSRNYDTDTMKVFLVVESLGEESLRSVYNPERRPKWQSFLQRLEACRLDLTRHEKTRERYQEFLEEVGKEEQSRQWFMAVLKLLNRLGAEDTFDYITTHSYEHEHKHYLPRHFDKQHHFYHRMTYRKRLIDLVPHAIEHHFHRHDEHQPLKERVTRVLNNEEGALVRGEETIIPDITAVDRSQRFGPGERTTFCDHLAKLFERKIETWFDGFQAVAVRLTAHVKVSGLVRVLSGKVHALATRKGRLHALVVKVTAQDTPRPLDVAELCLTKIMLIQNGLALPEELALDLLCLHLHPARPVLRLWSFTPSKEMEAAIRKADMDEMIDAAGLSQCHEMWPDNVTMDGVSTAENDDPAWKRVRAKKHLPKPVTDDSKANKDPAPATKRERARIPIPQYDFSPRRNTTQQGDAGTEQFPGAQNESAIERPRETTALNNSTAEQPGTSSRLGNFQNVLPRTPMSMSEW